MELEFEDWYLVCAEIESDEDDDEDSSTTINHVFCRRKTLQEAKAVAKQIQERTNFELYITPEKSVYSEELDDLLFEECDCKKGLGECAGDLFCSCNSLAKCKRVDKKIFSEE